MKTTIYTSVLALSLGMLSGVSAQTYSVQIGAYQNPSETTLESANMLGDVSTPRGNDGITRVRVGVFETSDAAMDTLHRARENGFEDAFITAVGSSGRSRAPDNAPASRKSTSTNSLEQRLAAARAKVSSDRHGDIVNLDGRLMLKEGETFRDLE